MSCLPTFTFFNSSNVMASSPDTSKKRTRPHGTRNRDGESLPSTSDGRKAAPSEESTPSPSDAMPAWGIFIVIEIIFIGFHYFPLYIDVGENSTFARIMDPGWVPVTFWALVILCWLVSALRAGGRRGPAVRGDNPGMIDIIECCAIANFGLYMMGDCERGITVAMGLGLSRIASAILVVPVVVLLLVFWMVAAVYGLPKVKSLVKSKAGADAKRQTLPVRTAGSGLGLGQDTPGKIHASVEMVLQRVAMYLGFAVYATMAATLHFLTVNEEYPPGYNILFSPYLAWLMKTYNLGGFLWMVTFLHHIERVPAISANVTSMLTRSQSRCNIMDNVCEMIKFMRVIDSIAICHWYLKAVYEHLPWDEAGTFMAGHIGLGFVIICFLVVSIGFMVTWGGFTLVDAFQDWMKKCQSERIKSGGIIQSSAEVINEKLSSSSDGLVKEKARLLKEQATLERRLREFMLKFEPLEKAQSIQFDGDDILGAVDKNGTVENDWQIVEEDSEAGG